MITRNIMPVFLNQNTYKAQKPMTARKENSASVQTMSTAPQQKLGFGNKAMAEIGERVAKEGKKIEKIFKEFVKLIGDKYSHTQRDRIGITLKNLKKEGVLTEKDIPALQEKTANSQFATGIKNTIANVLSAK